MVFTVGIGVEGEGVDKRLAVSLSHAPELSAAKDALAADGDDEKQLKIGTMMMNCSKS